MPGECISGSGCACYDCQWKNVIHRHKKAQEIEGVVKIITRFDVPKNYFPTAGHPWSLDENHQDIADRLLLTDRVLYYGDDVAVVVAKTELVAKQAADAIKITYEEYDFVLDPIEAMEDGASWLHENYFDNILTQTSHIDFNCAP